MVNEERVKNLYKIALYERDEKKYERQTGHYYKKDYIGKEMIKSFFVGTLAYGLLVFLWVISTLDDFLRSINNLEIIGDTVVIALLYIVFMVLYLMATYFIAVSRYKEGRLRLKEYLKALKVTKKMYEREEKLKI
jgi:hypothetical protein